MIEITTFRLAPGVTDDAFLVADTRFQQEFIPNHPGFVRRTTARSVDGEWVVVTLWGSADDADHSATSAADDDVVAGFVSLIDHATVVTKRFDELPG